MYVIKRPLGNTLFLKATMYAITTKGSLTTRSVFEKLGTTHLRSAPSNINSQK